ncbi:MAG: sialidase family protein [Flavobacteriaceae bacterium]|nr:sialidase family protein [Flavobacteriaceae bacterium]
MKRILFVFLFPLLIFSQKSDLKFYEVFSKSQNSKVSCYRIPSIITTDKGTIIAAADERVSSCNDLKSNRDINIVIRTSNDEGKSWSSINRLVDYPFGESASDPSMIFDKKTKQIYLFYNYMNLEKDKDVYYLKYVTSLDNGITWSQPIDITDQISKPEWKNDFKFITSGRGFQTRDGALLHCLVNLQNGTHVFGSNDHGKTWYIAEAPISLGDESKIVELNDGSWLVNSRVNNKGIRYSHISKNQGKSWTTRPEINLIDPGCNASLVKYDYGNYINSDLLLLSNINNQSTREEIVIRHSLNGGETWSEPRIIYAGSAAYSSMTVLNNGEIGLLFERDNYSKNVFTKFSLHWLMNN